MSEKILHVSTNQIDSVEDPLVTVIMNKSQYEHLMVLSERDKKNREYQRLRRQLERAKTPEKIELCKSKISQLTQKTTSKVS